MRAKKPRKKTAAEEEAELRAHPVNNFFCCNTVFDAKEFNDHLKDVHHLTEKADRGGIKQMISHLDGDFWWSSVFKWRLVGGLEFTQTIMHARAPDDYMRHG